MVGTLTEVHAVQEHAADKVFTPVRAVRPRSFRYTPQPAHNGADGMAGICALDGLEYECALSVFILPGAPAAPVDEGVFAVESVRQLAVGFPGLRL
ncbi:hypothetical protein AT728_18830 [Streptomyces silvensis]|uniref:Uncharacterized protein n=1 Tax=Streptomyces silvensis TaxID=1765722 RepID=A0A0W7X683_9ACTN|nr:hypothetical protein AT728_18830 [Streptomyces silvensis]